MTEPAWSIKELINGIPRLHVALYFFLLCLPGFVAIYNVFLKLMNIFVFIVVNALTAVGALMTLIDFTLSNARRFYSLIGNPFRGESKGLTLAFSFSDSVPTEITVLLLSRKVFCERKFLLTRFTWVKLFYCGNKSGNDPERVVSLHLAPSGTQSVKPKMGALNFSW